MAAKESSLVVASPFKLGFFAGLGFFVASVLMSVLTFVLFAVLGLGTVGAIGALLMNQTAHPAPHNVPKPAVAENDTQ